MYSCEANISAAVSTADVERLMEQMSGLDSVCDDIADWTVSADTSAAELQIHLTVDAAVEDDARRRLEDLVAMALLAAGIQPGPDSDPNSMHVQLDLVG